MIPIVARPYHDNDLLKIDDIFRKQPAYGLPGLSNAVIKSTIVKGDEVIGYGVVSNFAEATLILDQTKPVRDKAIALVEGMKVAIDQCRDKGIERLYISTPMLGFAKIMCRHYGFVECKDPYYLLEI